MNIEIAPFEYEKTLSIDDAMLYCFTLNIDGKTGWRLPTLTELKYITENNFMNSVHFGKFRNYSRFWSSEKHSLYFGCSWVIVIIDDADYITSWDQDTDKPFVLPVRDI
jgi:hypothetical protein